MQEKIKLDDEIIAAQEQVGAAIQKKIDLNDEMIALGKRGIELENEKQELLFAEVSVFERTFTLMGSPEFVMGGVRGITNATRAAELGKDLDFGVLLKYGSGFRGSPEVVMEKLQEELALRPEADKKCEIVGYFLSVDEQGDPLAVVQPRG